MNVRSVMLSQPIKYGRKAVHRLSFGNFDRVLLLTPSMELSVFLINLDWGMDILG